LLWMGCGLAGAGEPSQLRLKWEDLNPNIANQKVSFVLPDGTRVEGKVLGVEPDGLRLRVSKSSNRHSQPNGEHLIARGSVSFLRVTEYRKIGRLLGTAAAIGIAAGIVASRHVNSYEGYLAVIAPIAAAGSIAGSAIAGYYAGKALDKRVTEITVVPDGN
jgi:hypothetical protein